MQRFRWCVPAVLACLAVADPGAAQQAAPEASSESRPETMLTVYEGGFALVDDRRRIDLANGLNTLKIEDIPSEIDAGTVVASFPDSQGIHILNQRFRANGASLLASFVGRKVHVVRPHPTTGSDIVSDAILLAAEPRPVVDMGGRIEITPPGRIALPELPEEIALVPTLIFETAANQAGPAPFHLRYLADGFGWSADYALYLGPDETSAFVVGRATIVNTSGHSFRTVGARLVAGEVVRQRGHPAPPRPLQKGDMRMMAAEASLPAAGEPRAVSEVQVYDLPGRLNLRDGEETKVVLFSSRKVALRKRYEVTGRVFPGPRAGGDRDGEVSHPRTTIAFDNRVEEGMGVVLPQGVARLYGEDDLFLGESRIPHTPKGGRVTLDLGRARDITATRKRADFKTEKLPEGTVEVAYAVDLENAKDKAVTVEVVEILTGDWEVLAESQPHTKESASHAVWRIEVPANGKAALTYRAKLKLR